MLQHPSWTASLLALAAPFLLAGSGLAAGTPGANAPASARETRTFHLSLHGPADAVFPLFGPVREAEWSPGWAPRFVYPPAPAQGPDGAVFTTDGDSAASVWVMNEYDPAHLRVRYTVFHPGLSVGEIAIAVTPEGATRAGADVTYRFTALSPAGSEAVARWVAHFPHMAPHWEQALNARLGGAAPADPLGTGH